MLKLLNGLMDRIFVVAGALAFSQAPQFYQSYTQRLGGHVSELKLQIAKMQHVAEKSGKTLSEFIQKFKNQTDIDFSEQGKLMQSMIDRFSELTESHSSMLHSSILSRPYYFIKHFNYDIAKMTAAEFNFGFALTIEGLLYAFAGLLFGFFIYRGLCSLLKIFRRAFTAISSRI